MDMITYVFLVWIAPFWFFISIGILAILGFLIPKSAWTLTKSRLAKNSSIGILASDDGVLRIEVLENIFLGLFKSREGKRRYFFLPRPKFSLDDSQDASLKFSHEEKRMMDQEMLKRHVLGDIKKVCYLGYTGKCVVGSAAVLKQFEASDDLQNMADESNRPTEDIKVRLKRALDSDKKLEDKLGIQFDYFWVYALDPRKWKDYMRLAFNQAGIDALCYTHEQIGLEGRPNKKMGIALIIIILIGLGVLIFLLLSGGKIPGMK